MDCCHTPSDNGLVNEIYFNNVWGGQELRRSRRMLNNSWIQTRDTEVTWPKCPIITVKQPQR